ncbi:MAG: hypothetical protein HKN90_01465 [Flavobacteriaceae bacterium]|nr:hypothetical protein [Flavobacteriaceae bacterium]
MLILLTSILLVCSTVSIAQQDSTVQDSIIKSKYGLRIGIDLFNPAAAIFDDRRSGLELVADYRISKKWYVAAELGYLENNSDLDNIDFTTTGQYIKMGADYNAYENWLDMENAIYIGARYGFSTFNHKVNSGIINADPIFGEQSISLPQEFDGLNAHWAELIIGIKAELFNNFYLGFSFSGKKMITTKEADNFKNLFVPGFNRVFLNNSGFGFNYTMSYLIPLYKKAK